MVKNMSDLTKPQIRKYKIDGAKLIKGSKHSMYVHENIAIKIIMQSRLLDPRTIKFRSDLGFNQINLVLKKEQSVVIPLLKAFSKEKIKLQHKAIKNERVRSDMYFSEHKFAVEIDEKGYTDRNEDKEDCNLFTGLILMQKTLIFFLKLVKYWVTLLNKIKKRKRKGS